MAILFLKASGAPRKIAGQAGYVKINGRWHKAGADTKAPKTAPKAAHPQAAGKHKAYDMPSEHVSKLLYDQEKAAKNHEMKNFNEKHVPSLVAHAKEGDATAILGHKYGTNTHAKKLVAIANHLLEQMGSSHKVTLGQEAGSHEAVSKAPTEDQAQAVAKEAVQVAAEAVSQPEPAADTQDAPKAATSGLAMPAFMSGKQSKGVRTAYEQHGQKIMDAVDAGDIQALQALVNPAAGAWKGKTANSKMLLGLYAQGLAKLQKKGQRLPTTTDEPSAVAAVETMAAIPAQPKPTAKVATNAVADIDWSSFETPAHIKSAKGYNQQLEAVKNATIAGDVYAILANKYGTNTYAKKVAQAANLALTKLGHPHLKVVLGKAATHPALQAMQMPSPSPDEVAQSQQVAKAKEKGPAEGETRLGKTGTLVFKDGHWVKQDTGEEAKKSELKLSVGGSVTPSQMKDLPVGSIVQTYDKDGNPSHQFRIGHNAAWFITAKGKQHVKPIQKGQFMGLMGYDQSHNGYTDDPYVGGYHAKDHPTTIVKLGDKNYHSKKQVDVLKAYFPGADSISSPGVFSIMNGEYLLMFDIQQPKKAIAINELGEAYLPNHIPEIYGHMDYIEVLAGGGKNLADKFGLVSTPAAEAGSAPEHPDATVNATLKKVEAALFDNDHAMADHHIMTAAGIIKDLPGSAESVEAMTWLVAAKEKAHSSAKGVKAEVPEAPAPDMPETKMEPLPRFADVEAFAEWDKAHGDDWMDKGVLHYGSDEAFNESPEGKAFMEWAVKHEAHMMQKKAQEKAAKTRAENKAKKVHLESMPDFQNPTEFNSWSVSDAGIDWAKQVEGLYGSDEAFEASEAGTKYNAWAEKYAKQQEEGPHEGDTKPGVGGTLVFHNGHWVLQGVPVTQENYDYLNLKLKEAGSASEATETAFAFLAEHKNGPDAIEKLKGLLEKHGYTNIAGTLEQAVKPVTEEEFMQAAAKMKPEMPELPPNSMFATQAKDVQAAIEDGNLSAINDAIYMTQGLKAASAMKLHEYAVKAKAHLEATGEGGMTDAKVAELKDILNMDAGASAKTQKIDNFLEKYGHNDEAYAIAAQHFQDKEIWYKGKAYALKGIQKNGIPADAPEMPKVASYWSDDMLSALGVVKYLDQAGAEYHLLGIMKSNAEYTSVESAQVNAYVGQLYTKLTGKAPPAEYMENPQEAGKPAETPAAEEGPKEGDIKQGKGGLLVLKDGHWVKMGADEVPVPDFSAGNSPNGYAKLAQALKDAFTSHGKKAASAPGLSMTAHKDGTVSIAAGGVKIKKFGAHSTNDNTKKLWDYLNTLKVAVGSKGVLPGETQPEKPKAATTAAPVTGHTPDTGAIDYEALEKADTWKKVGGQKGSNEGESLEDESGQKWYVKYPKDHKHAQAEVLAAQMYAALGFKSQDAKLVMKDGKMGIASRWIDGLKQGTPAELAKAKGALDGFLVDAWMGNRDVVGMTYDNMQIDSEGDAVRVDAGASFMYRAQGGIKEFGDDPTEMATLLDKSMNSQTHSVFGKMKTADFQASAAILARMNDAKIRVLVNKYGPGSKAERKKLANVLIARKNAILEKYPVNEKGQPIKVQDPTKLTVDAERLPDDYNFANWMGTGKGLSSKPDVNAANDAIIAELKKLALKGNLPELEQYKFKPLGGGEPVSVQMHPSKHIQAYHAALVEVLKEIANPPVALKLFHEVDLDSVDELEAAFPPKQFGTTVKDVKAQEQLGFWVALGKVTKATVAKLKPKKTQSYSSAAIEHAYERYKKADKLTRAFINGIQASGSYNDLFRDGKTHDHAGNDLKEVAKAALAFSTEQPEGTTITRWQNMPHGMVKKFLDAEEGHMITATGPMCTSYSPTATKHFGEHRITIRYAKGARAVESFGSGSFAGEKEVTTLPGARFMLLEKPTMKDGRLEIELLMLPPDIGVE